MATHKGTQTSDRPPGYVNPKALPGGRPLSENEWKTPAQIDFEKTFGKVPSSEQK